MSDNTESLEIISEITSSNNGVKNNILKRLSELGDRMYRLPRIKIIELACLSKDAHQSKFSRSV
jgi:hypothetical protein